jgi:hypothetical protein
MTTRCWAVYPYICVHYLTAIIVSAAVCMATADILVLNVPIVQNTDSHADDLCRAGGDIWVDMDRVVVVFLMNLL